MVTIRDHMDSLCAMVGSTLPRECIWDSRYIVTVENEKQVNNFLDFQIFQIFFF
jgi:hypothetical protein